ncbi:Alpha/beta hydrolase domain-containing protein 17C [Phytophthora cinnamomi]|uniref:Alpha/beta hydrolase domain-containing protein 17C n=1 Tax=Phytophthora cinnamomi TaxID=4785 RepID=UPI00355ABFC2|nr:Alpha/beta hydrolase domain-containing protein 17C [Phytophthora cinnamomi]
MNVWSLDDEPVVSRPRVKKASFADVEVEAASTSGWGAGSQSQRRKQRGKVEFLVDDQQDSDDEDDERHNRKALDSNGAPELTSTKANEVISADIVQSVNSAEPTHTHESTQEQKSVPPNQEGTVHFLVREFLLMHCYDDVVKILDQERPMPLLGDAEIKELNQRLAGTDGSQANPTAAHSLLERFIMCSNEAKIKARAKRSAKDRSASAEKKTRGKESSSGRRKPVLNVITSNLDQRADTNANATPLNGQVSGDYNRLNHPGSTPHHQPHETVMGEPGSTPMARAKDLRALGYEDIDEDDNKLASDQLPQVDHAGDNADQLSQYALRKRASRSGPKHVQLGNPGSTPTKEYIFFRETPPSFVTETIEEAVEVFEKLGSDPEFVKQAAVVERYIELQSSEVSKYSVGQSVNGLGAQSNISGVVSKIYGSRLCGTAGPGTIVIDTSPEEPLVSNA